MVDDDDADTRMAGWQKRVAGHVTPARMLADVSAAMDDVVTGPISKGDLSTEVARRLPDETFWCETCKAQHVPDITFRLAALQARLYVVRTNPTVLAPWPQAARTGAVNADEARAGLARAFLRVQGPTSLRLLTTWLGAGRHSMDAGGQMSATCNRSRGGSSLYVLADNLDAYLSAGADGHGWAALVPGKDRISRPRTSTSWYRAPRIAGESGVRCSGRARCWSTAKWPGRGDLALTRTASP